MLSGVIGKPGECCSFGMALSLSIVMDHYG
jgi:hypothetical protein